jgi:hypothetical protein
LKFKSVTAKSMKNLFNGKELQTIKPTSLGHY